jgi:hypothetical protein
MNNENKIKNVILIYVDRKLDVIEPSDRGRNVTAAGQHRAMHGILKIHC